MKNLAYIYIDEDMTPRSAADKLKMAKDGGADNILVLHRKDAPFYTAQYKEKLLALFRAAYRNKVRLYLGDDSYFASGTGFGQVCSVRAVRGKTMAVKNKSEVTEGEEVIAEQGDECVTISVMDDKTAEHYDFYPDVTNPECAALVIDCVYKPLLREFEKFKGYEFAGFYCAKPCPLTLLGEHRVYMKAVVDKFEKEHKRTPNFFDIVEKRGDFEEYARLAAVCVEEVFLEALRSYCEENGVELAVGSISHEYAEYCAKNDLIQISEMGAKGCYQIPITDIRDVLDFAPTAKGAVWKVQQGMDKLSKLWDFLQKNSDAKVVMLDKFNSCDKDCYIIRNDKSDPKVSFLLEGDWCVLDWENDNIYDFDKKGVYDFGINGFLCIKRKTADVYTERLPVRVGGMLTKELEYVQSLEFARDKNKFSFTLPEESLSGKYIDFSVGGNYLSVKMGYNRYESITHPFLFPLYDFLCGSECEGDVGDGELHEIFIYEIKKD
ncbi:MAG: hypothetical protein IJ435_08020 [Clostridia bacterium]|nr:hypothetical protein [Clostridia bacterium]